MAIPTTRAALTAYITKNPHLEQISVLELAEGLMLHFQQHAALCRSVATSLGMSKREQQWPQLVAKRYAISFCGCARLAEVLLTGGYVAYPVEASLF